MCTPNVFKDSQQFVFPRRHAGQLAAIEEWLDATDVAWRHGRLGARAQRNNLDTQLMPQNPRIGEERLLAAIRMQIGTANPGA